MIRDDLLKTMIYPAIEEADLVAESSDELDDLVAELQVKLAELGVTDVFNTIDPIVSAMNALRAETTKAAYLLGFRHGQHPELLIFKDGSTA